MTSRSSFIALVAVLMIGLAPAPSFAQIQTQFGVQGGVNFANVDFTTTDPEGAPDFKNRTLGVGGILAGSLLYFAGSGRLVVHEVLVALFLFVTAPVSALMLARAAIRLHVRSQAPLPKPKPRD